MCRVVATHDGDALRDHSEFFDHVHGPLLTLAADVSERDRSVAAMLLEAKNGAEKRSTPDPAGGR